MKKLTLGDYGFFILTGSIILFLDWISFNSDSSIKIIAMILFTISELIVLGMYYGMCE